MQTSAKTKAKEFVRNLNNHLGMDAVSILPCSILEEVLRKSLLEHERDTRYTAIDTVQSMDDEVNYENSFDVINRDAAVKLIHNLKVGF